jgi:hypothetical protein
LLFARRKRHQPRCVNVEDIADGNCTHGPSDDTLKAVGARGCEQDTHLDARLAGEGASFEGGRRAGRWSFENGQELFSDPIAVAFD